MQTGTFEAGQPEKLLSKMKPKFLRRSAMLPYLLVNDKDEEDEIFPRKRAQRNKLTVIPELRVKRFYYRKLSEYIKIPQSSSIYCKIPKQTLKYMTHIHIRHNIQLQYNGRKNIISILKNSRCLKRVQLEQHRPSDLSYFCQLLKYAGNHIQEISLSQTSATVEQNDVCRFYRALSFFPKLKILTMSVFFFKKGLRSLHGGEEDYFDLETKLIQKYLEKLPCLKEVRVSNWNQSNALGKFFRNKDSQRCPLVTSLDIIPRPGMLPEDADLNEILKYEEISSTGLKILTPSMSIRSTLTYQQYIRDLFKSIEGKDADEEQNRKSLERNELEYEESREQLINNFDFSVFPNLRSLRLNFSIYFIQDATIMVGGFAILKNLEQLTLDFDCRPNGTYFIFEEILSLPSLTRFSIRIPFIRSQEWHLLTQFLQKQHNLTSLHLEVTKNNIPNHPLHRELILGLENVLKALENTPKLEHLDLLFFDCPFNKFAQQRISQSLAQASLTVKQLKSFSFSGSFLPVGLENSSWDHLEGFCKFLHQQKSTLSSLAMSFISLIDAGAAIYLSKILPDLDQLETFKFNGRTFGSGSSGKLLVNNDLLSELSRTKIREVIKLQNLTWKSLAYHFAKVLPRVPKLAELGLILRNSDIFGDAIFTADVIDGYHNSPKQEKYLTIISILPKLKALRNLFIGFPDKLFDDIWETKAKGVLLCLKDVNSIKISLPIPQYGAQSEFCYEAYKIVDAYNAKQVHRAEYQNNFVNWFDEKLIS